MNNDKIRPEIAELLELVQTRLGMTTEAARGYIGQVILCPEISPTDTFQTAVVEGEQLHKAVATFHAMPSLA